MLGVSFDAVDENRAFAEKFNFPFLLLCDTKKDIGVSYGACPPDKKGFAARIGYVIDPQGKVKKAYARADARTFPEDALKAL